MEVEILGKLTRVNCPPGQEDALNAAANELNRRLNQMTERTKVHNIEQLLIIAALNACYEVQELKNEIDDSKQMAQRIEQLSQALDQALTKR